MYNGTKKDIRSGRKTEEDVITMTYKNTRGSIHRNGLDAYGDGRRDACKTSRGKNTSLGGRPRGTIGRNEATGKDPRKFTYGGRESIERNSAGDGPTVKKNNVETLFLFVPFAKQPLISIARERCNIENSPVNRRTLEPPCVCVRVAAEGSEVRRARRVRANSGYNYNYRTDKVALNSPPIHAHLYT